MIPPALLISVTAASAVVAAVTGRPVWAAVLGAGLCLGYWALEVLTERRARGRRDLALGLAIGGMLARLALVLAVLVSVGLLARPAFATTVISFLAAFTLYTPARLFTHPHAGASPGGARAS
ncbi:MAG: hypothetical protein WC709_07110 [Thermoleophilia bacterium]